MGASKKYNVAGKTPTFDTIIYIIHPDKGEPFWREELPCDPNEFACEEF